MTPWRRKEVIEGCTLYLGDSLEITPHIGKVVGSVVSDPPYGIEWKPRVNHNDQDKHWIDNIEFDPSLFLSVGKYHLFWGGQYYANKLPTAEGWLTWCKRPIDIDFSNDNRSYATTELAWRDWGKSKFYAQVWDGGRRAGVTDNRTFCHPSQKPVELMDWCLRQLPKDHGIILDPFLGSGTTLVAVAKLGLKGIGVELDETYFDIACDRIRKAYAQPDMFVEAARPAEQVDMEF